MTAILVIVGWLAIGASATYVGNRTLNRRYPLADTSGYEIGYMLAVFGPINLIAVICVLKPWRK